jgi:anti-sigma factor (TIGR02949 family)
MNCPMALRMLDAFIDNELDGATTAEVAEHVENCAACVALRDQRVAMQSALRATSLRHVAPPELRSAIVRRIRQSLNPVPRSVGLRWWQVLVRGSSTAILVRSGLVGRAALCRRNAARIRQTRHVASLRPEGPRIDVASSDRHVVRPWFQGRLDFAPMVRDLSAQGFDPLGARLDRIGGKQAVAIVIGCMVMPSTSFVACCRPSAGTGTGIDDPWFQCGHLSQSDMNYAAVSDTDSAELKRFTTAYRAQ